MTKKITKTDLPNDLSKIAKDIYKSVGVELNTKLKSKVASFDLLLNPLKEAYEEIIIKKNKRFIWKGQKEFVADNLKSTMPSIDQLFNYQTMKAYQEKTGRDFVEQILISAIQIGIDQGIQIGREEANIKNSRCYR